MAARAERQPLPPWRPPSAVAERRFAQWSLFGTGLGALGALTLAIADGGVRGIDLALLATLTVVTSVGVGGGLHRLFSHQSFEIVRPGRWLLGLAGVAAGQGYFVRWVYDHRVHHQYTDQPGDPHSPHWVGTQRLHGWRGIWHAHAGWLFGARQPIEPARVGDVLADPFLCFLDRHGPAITTAGILLPAAVAWAWQPDGGSALRGALWGGCVRMAIVNHITWAVNSFGHALGAKLPGQSSEARNNRLLALLALGDGWHANHHAHPRLARHGWGRSQPDFNAGLIAAAQRFGWVRVKHMHPPATLVPPTSEDAPNVR